MIRLFIENTELELGEDFSCPITRTFEDIENPTNIKNDFSKTVTIPHTQHNDQLFGHIYNPDRLVVANQKNEALLGIYFNPYKKIDFRLEWNDSVVMTGYLKVLSVSDKGYECTLNGELGKIFQEMQKITFDENKYEGEEKEKYWIDSSEYVNTKINKELVFESWNSDGPTSTKLRKIGDVGYRVTDIIGYTPNNSFNQDFDYKTFQVGDHSSSNFSKVLENDTWDWVTFEQITGITPETAIGDGLTPRAVGEFRSYLQQPFIYWNQLWQIYQEKVENLTGYKFDLDPEWFNSSNPYWTKAALTLMNFDQIQKQITEYNLKSNIRISFSSIEPILYFTNNKWTIGNSIALDISTNSTAYDKFLRAFKPIKKNNYLLINDLDQDLKIAESIDISQYPHLEKMCLRADSENVKNTVFKHIYINVIDRTGNVLETIWHSVTYNEESTVRYQGDSDFEFTVSYKSYNINQSINSVLVTDAIHIPKNIMLQNINVPFIFSLSVKYTDYEGNQLVDDAKIYQYIDDNGYKLYFNANTVLPAFPLTTVNSLISLQSSYYHTNSNFSLDTLWNNSETIYNQIMNYCKRFRILIETDDVRKVIKFRQSTNYFENYKILNFNDKIDKSKDYKITPITFENHKILFNYEDIKTQIGEKYKSSVGYNFGEKQLTTQYNFNSEEKKLFSKINSGICSTFNDKSWKVLLGTPDGGISVVYPDVYYITPAEVFANFSDKDNKQTDSFGCLFFVNSANFDDATNLRNVKISDDTTLQNYTGEYFYSNVQKSTDKYLQLNDVYGDKCILFSVPKENYTYLDSHYDNCKGIYDLFWEKYITERYNTQNKLVTCYLKLTPSDFVNFEFNKFIQIDNQLYMVNKIYDYDITNDEPTKVDLITIQDIKGYTTNNLQ